MEKVKMESLIPVNYSIRLNNQNKGMKTLPNQCVHTVITSPPYYGRKFIGTELNPEYVELAQKRLSVVQTQF